MSKGKAAPSFSLNSFVAPAKEDWYKHLTFEEAIDRAKEKMVATAENFVAMGYYLKHIWDGGLYVNKGYHNIWDCAEAELHLSQATASRYINICKKFSKDGDSPFLDDRYKEFGKSQLQELLSINDARLIEQIKPDMSVKQIQKLKKDKADAEKAEQQVSGENAKENSKELEAYRVLSGQMEVAIDGTYREFNVGEAEDGEESMMESDIAELETNSAPDNVVQEESRSNTFGIDDVIKSFDNAWMALTKQYQNDPNEGVRQAINLLSKIIGQVKYEIKEAQKEKRITIDEWTAMLHTELQG